MNNNFLNSPDSDGMGKQSSFPGQFSDVDFFGFEETFELCPKPSGNDSQENFQEPNLKPPQEADQDLVQEADQKIAEGLHQNISDGTNSEVKAQTQEANDGEAATSIVTTETHEPQISYKKPNPVPASQRITLKDLEKYYHYPLTEVAKVFNISTTVLKRVCRRCGIQRWPHRQIRSIISTIEQLKEQAAILDPPQSLELLQQVALLEKKKKLVTRTSSCGLNATLRNAIFMARPGEVDEEILFNTGLLPNLQRAITSNGKQSNKRKATQPLNPNSGPAQSTNQLCDNNTNAMDISEETKVKPQTSTNNHPGDPASFALLNHLANLESLSAEGKNTEHTFSTQISHQTSNPLLSQHKPLMFDPSNDDQQMQSKALHNSSFSDAENIVNFASEAHNLHALLSSAERQPDSASHNVTKPKEENQPKGLHFAQDCSGTHPIPINFRLEKIPDSSQSVNNTNVALPRSDLLMQSISPSLDQLQNGNLHISAKVDPNPQDNTTQANTNPTLLAESNKNVSAPTVGQPLNGNLLKISTLNGTEVKNESESQVKNTLNSHAGNTPVVCSPFPTSFLSPADLAKQYAPILNSVDTANKRTKTENQLGGNLRFLSMNHFPANFQPNVQVLGMPQPSQNPAPPVVQNPYSYGYLLHPSLNQRVQGNVQPHSLADKVQNSVESAKNNEQVVHVLGPGNVVYALPLYPPSITNQNTINTVPPSMGYNQVRGPLDAKQNADQGPPPPSNGISQPSWPAQIQTQIQNQSHNTLPGTTTVPGNLDDILKKLSPDQMRDLLYQALSSSQNQSNAPQTKSAEPR